MQYKYKYKSRLLFQFLIILTISIHHTDAQMFKSKIFNIQPLTNLSFYKSFLSGDSITILGGIHKNNDFPRIDIQVLKIDTSLNIGSNYAVEKSALTNTEKLIKSGNYYYTRTILYDNNFTKIDSNFIIKIHEQTGNPQFKTLNINDNYTKDYRITNFNDKIKLSYEGVLQGHYGLIMNTYDTDLNCLDTVFSNNGNLNNNDNLIFSEDNLYIIINKPAILNGVHCDGKYLIKFDMDLNIVWEKPIFYDKIPYQSQGQLFFWGEKICFIVKTQKNLSPSSIASVINFALIDTDGNVEWQFGIDADNNDYLSAWKILKNGNLLVGGSCYNTSSGFKDARLLKISQQDALLWDRFYTDKEHFEFRESAFHTFEELPGGNIIAIGSFANKIVFEAEEMGWIVKLDQNGCPGYDCGGMVTDYSLDAKNKIRIPEMIVYPNPGNNEIKLINNQIVSMTGDLFICDIYGNMLMRRYNTYSDVNIDVSNLPSGNYYIKFISENNSYIAKWLKI